MSSKKTERNNVCVRREAQSTNRDSHNHSWGRKCRKTYEFSLHSTLYWIKPIGSKHWTRHRQTTGTKREGHYMVWTPWTPKITSEGSEIHKMRLQVVNDAPTLTPKARSTFWSLLLYRSNDWNQNCYGVGGWEQRWSAQSRDCAMATIETMCSKRVWPNALDTL